MCEPGHVSFHHGRATESVEPLADGKATGKGADQRDRINSFGHITSFVHFVGIVALRAAACGRRWPTAVRASAGSRPDRQSYRDSCPASRSAAAGPRGRRQRKSAWVASLLSPSRAATHVVRRSRSTTPMTKEDATRCALAANSLVGSRRTARMPPVAPCGILAVGDIPRERDTSRTSANASARGSARAATMPRSETKLVILTQLIRSR